MQDIYNQIKSIKSLEFSFTDSHGVLQKIVGSIKLVENEHIIIIANIRRNKKKFAKSGNEINVYIYAENGVFKAVSKIIDVFIGVASIEYVISPLEKSQHFQRREYFRERMSIEANITMITKSPQLNDYMIFTKTRNICGKGMSFVSDYVISDCDLIIVELHFPEKTIAAVAIPIHYQKMKYYGKSKIIHGFSFIDIEQKDIDFIVKKCFLHQLKMLKNKPL